MAEMTYMAEMAYMAGLAGISPKPAISATLPVPLSGRVGGRHDLLSRLAAVVALGPGHWRARCPACGEARLDVLLLAGEWIYACAAGCLGRTIRARLESRRVS